MKKILDLGCGTAKVKDAIGLDNADLPGVDSVHDLLEFPYPLRSNSFDTIYLRHVIEHFEIQDIEKIFSECHRLLVTDGLLEIRVPHTFCSAAFTDPTHKRFFTFDSGKFWDCNNPKAYYKETQSVWQLVNTSSRVTIYDWKRYRLRKIDRWLSNIFAKKINKALRQKHNPSLADRLVQKKACQFVEIAWTFKKVN